MNREKGFTLIEILMAVAIFSVILGAVYKTYNTQQKSYILQEEVAAMQQNARASLYMISRDTRMAGAMLGIGGLGWVDPESGNPAVSWGIENFDAWTTGGADRLDIVYVDFNCNATITDPMPTPSSILHSTRVSCLQVGDLIIIADGNNSNLFEITHLQETMATGNPILNVQHNPASPYNLPSNPNWPGAGYQPGAKLFRAKYISYTITNTDPDHPRMGYSERPPADISYAYQPLADNVEDFQVAFVFADGDEADTANSSDGDSTNDHADIRGVRVNVLSRTDREINTEPGTRPAIENHAAGSSQDRYIRRLYTTEVKTRNVGLGL